MRRLHAGVSQVREWEENGLRRTRRNGRLPGLPPHTPAELHDACRRNGRHLAHVASPSASSLLSTWVSFPCAGETQREITAATRVQCNNKKKKTVVMNGLSCASVHVNTRSITDVKHFSARFDAGFVEKYCKFVVVSNFIFHLKLKKNNWSKCYQYNCLDSWICGVRNTQLNKIFGSVAVPN